MGPEEHRVVWRPTQGMSHFFFVPFSVAGITTHDRSLYMDRSPEQCPHHTTLNDYFSSLARAAACDNLSHVDERPDLVVTPLTDR